MANKKKSILKEEDFAPENVKERISIMLDQDILDFFREKAAREGSKYQTLINSYLRKTINPESDPNEMILKRLERIEKRIFKKGA